jgi:hypothetical protein
MELRCYSLLEKPFKIVSDGVGLSQKAIFLKLKLKLKAVSEVQNLWAMARGGRSWGCSKDPQM